LLAEKAIAINRSAAAVHLRGLAAVIGAVSAGLGPEPSTTFMSGIENLLE
jgi:hypothetical protein